MISLTCMPKPLIPLNGLNTLFVKRISNTTTPIHATRRKIFSHVLGTAASLVLPLTKEDWPPFTSQSLSLQMVVEP